MPHASKYLMRHAPNEQYVFEECVSLEECQEKPWLARIREAVAFARAENATHDSERRVRTVAVFFRTNAEVFQGYTCLRELQGEDVRLRIQ